MRRFFKQVMFLIPVLGMVASCTPEINLSTEEKDIAVTNYDENQDFSQLSKFYLYDTVIYVTDEKNPSPVEGHEHDELIISNVRQNLLNLGWTEVTDTTNNAADVAILLTTLKVDVYYYYQYWDYYWGWYPWGWWYPGWGGGYYPGYPNWGVAYGYSAGTVLVDMLNLNGDVVISDDPDNPRIDLPLVWSGGVNGILSGSNENIADRLTRQLNQVFAQSPYLSKQQPK